MMAQLQNAKPAVRRFILADKFTPKPVHEVQKTASDFGAPIVTTAPNFDGRDPGMEADADLQASVKAALAAFAD